MGLDGVYSNIGQETLLALHKAALSGNKIEANELASIQTAAQADGNLSKGEQDLLSKLKEATKDKRALSDFQLADFDPAASAIFGGADLQIQGKRAELKALRAHEAPQLRLARETMGQAARVMDMGRSMTPKEYGNLYYTPGQYFGLQQERLKLQLKSLDGLITQLRQGKRGDSTTLAKLEQMKALTQTLIDIQAKIGAAGNSDQRLLKSDALGVSKLLDKALVELAGLTPTDLGEQNHALLKSSLEDYLRICNYFPTMRQRTGDSPALAPQLNQFFMQAHYRVQEIRGPQRNRPEETPDVNGAIYSYMYDMKDMQEFMRHFDACERLLKQNQYDSLEAYTGAVLAKLGPTSESFKQSARDFAAAGWHSWQASKQQSTAEGKLTQARSLIDAAEGELDQAEQAIGGVRFRTQLSQVALLQGKPEGAEEVMKRARELRKQADGHMQRYQDLLSQGKVTLADARKYRRAAEASLNLSNHFIGLVEAGTYAKDFEKQLQELKGDNRAIAGRMASFDSQAAALGQRIAGLEQRANGLRADLVKLDGELELADLRVKAGLLSKKSIAQTRQELGKVFAEHKVAISPLLKQYLSDPSKVPADQLANLRAEMQQLFEANPKLAGAVATELTRFRSDFAQLRGELEQLLAQASERKDAAQVDQLQKQLRALNVLEHQTVTSWLGEQGPLIEALMAARGNSQQVEAAVADTVQWFGQTQSRYAGGLIEDPNGRKQLVERFESALSDPSMQTYADKIAKTTASYGEPLQKTPMLLVLDGTGALMNFNAYVYRDGDRFMALNPIDQKFYYGDSPEAALGELASKSRVAKGTLHYHDGNQARQSPMQAPPDTSTSDKVMTGLAIGGGIALLLLPEPTSKLGAAALFASAGAVGVSSAYFATKGLMSLSDLHQNGNLGYNRETALAAFDFGSGLLGVAGGAGALGRTAQIARVENALGLSLSKLAPMGSSRLLGGLELADGALGLGVTAEQIVDIYNNPKLSDQEKASAIAQIGLFTATPFLLAGTIARNRGTDAQIEGTHSTLDGNLAELGRFLDEPLLPEVQKASRQNLELTLKQADDFYNSPQMKARPELRRQGLEQIAALRKKLDGFTAAPATSAKPVRPDTPNPPSKPLPGGSSTPRPSRSIDVEQPPIKPDDKPPVKADDKPPIKPDDKPPLDPVPDAPEPPVKLENQPLRELPARVDVGEGVSSDKAKADALDMFNAIAAREGLSIKTKGDGTVWADRAASPGKPEMRIYLKPKVDGAEIEIHVNKDKSTSAPAFKHKMTYLASEAPLTPGKPPGGYRDELLARGGERVKGIVSTDSVQNLSGGQRGPVLAALVDRLSGRVFYGTNTPDKTVPTKLHPIMEARLKAYNDYLEANPGSKSPKDIHPPGSHAEFIALNEALLARDPEMKLKPGDVDLKDFEFVNLRLEGKPPFQGSEIECCSNCSRLTDGAGQLSGVKSVTQEAAEMRELESKRNETPKP